MKTIKAKRLAAFLISLVMMLSLIPTTALAAPTSERYGSTAISQLENGENLQWAYDILKNGVENSAETISFQDGSGHSITSKELDAVLEVYRNDYPQHFWLGKQYTVHTNGGTVMSIEPFYTMTGDQLISAKNAFNTTVELALSGITEDMSEFEIELYLHDYLANKVAYTLEATYAHDAYGALVEGKAVCEGYARAFQYLLMQAGIPSYVVTGESKGEAHAWNLVKIDGEYYYVDLTWDDQGNDNFYAYFNVTTERLEEDHTIAEQVYDLPTCTATAANYFTIYGGDLAAGDLDTICALLDRNDLFARVYITGDTDAFKTWIENNIQSIVNKMGITGNVRYSYSHLGREFHLRIEGDYTHVHNLTHVDAVAANCHETGTVEHWNCDKCGKNYADAEGARELNTIETQIDSTNHVGGTEVRDNTEASCEKTGYTGDTYCLGCNQKLSTGTVIPKTHTMEHVAAVPGTCKDLGTKEHWHCTTCNKDFAEKTGDTVLTDLTTAKDPANHAGGTTIKNEAPATCTTPGNTGDTYCNGCDAKLKSGTVLPAGHTMNHVDAVPATCKDTGTAEHWHCSVCDKDFKDEAGATELSDLTLAKDPNNHVGGTHKENAADPGCDQPGFTGDIYCDSCNAKIADGQNVPAGHITSLVAEVPATCKDFGVMAHWHCSRCEKDFEDKAGTKELSDLTLDKDSTNHVGETELRDQIAPSCKADGYTGDVYCLACDQVVTPGKPIRTSHALTFVPTKTPTCQDAGNRAYWQCSCGKVYDTDADRTELASADTCQLPKDPNNHVGFKTEWSMDADNHWHACTACGAGKNALAAHVFDNSCDTTCNTCGYTREITHTPSADYSHDDTGHWKVCSVCGKTIEALETHKGGKATCIAKAICTVCGQPYGTTGAHNASNWHQTKAPTFTEPGEKTGHCDVCNKDVIAIVPMLTIPMDNKDSGNTKLIKTDLTSVPSALENIETLNTLDKIRDVLRNSILKQKDSVPDSNIKYYDVTIVLIGAGGEYMPLTPDNLPANGEVTILLAYPEGTNKNDYAFYASHIITDALYGEVGSVETPTVKATDAGLEITIHGTSPVALGWYKTASAPRYYYNSSTTTADQPKKTSSPTGDFGILAYALCGTGSLGLGAILVTSKRRRH